MTIPKSFGRVILIDKCDVPLILSCAWSCNNKGYARSKLGFLHRVLLGAKEGEEVDHINRIRLDCRRKNLRLVTHSENHYNTRVRTDNTSGCKGVSWHKQYNKWQATIHADKKQIFLGRFTDLEEAKAARKAAEERYHNVACP